MFNHGNRQGFRFAGPLHHGFGHHRHGWGDHGPWNGPGFGGPKGRRRFEKGDLKYVILDLIKDEPRHGYDVIRALEERFHGFYSPSPGSVYPTLQLLEDQGLASSSERDGKRVYTITDEGRKFLAERADTLKDLNARLAAGWGHIATPELRELVGEVRQLGRFLFQQGASGALNDPEKIRRLREIVASTRLQIEEMFREETVTSV